MSAGISIHAPPRGATSGKVALSWQRCTFQFTPLREGRHRGSMVSAIRRYFNSRPSARGDLPSIHRTYCNIFQFTPLREGRPFNRLGVFLGSHISIHAPPRGATAWTADRAHVRQFQFTPLREGRHPRTVDFPTFAISIHAPPRGATRWIVWHDLYYYNFNSRPSARGDFPRNHFAQGGLISIHAPPRGATAKDMQFLQIFCSTLTNQHGLTIVPRNLSRLFW